MDERVSVNFVKFVSTLVPFGSLVSHVSSNATPMAIERMCGGQKQ